MSATDPVEEFVMGITTLYSEFSLANLKTSSKVGQAVITAPLKSSSQAICEYAPLSPWNAILISVFNNENIYNNEEIGDCFLQYDPLFLFINDKYYNISKTTKLGSSGTFEIHHQYNILQDGRIELLSFDSNSDNLNASPAQNPFLNIVEVNILNIPMKNELKIKDV